MSAATPAPPAVESEPCVVLHAIGWGQYEKILEALPEQAGLRIIYLDGRLTFLSPSYRHEFDAERCGLIVVAIANGLGIAWEQAGHTTYRQEAKRGGVEGDKTFYFGEDAEHMLGVDEIDLTTQPPPSLAIEVEATHPADDAVAVWWRLGVPEVWRLDEKRGALTFGVRRDDGTYAPSPRSAAFPFLEPDDVLAQLRLAAEVGSSRWFAQLDGWVRTVLLPRRGV